MTKQKDHLATLRQAALAGVALGALLAVPTYALAQEVETTSAADEATDEDLKKEESIVVTGSRLKRSSFTSISPLQVLDGEVSRDLGLLDASSMLSSLSVVSGQQNTSAVSTGFNGGLQQAFTTIGSVTPSLRGLGSSVTGRSRSLVLVNGRRFGPIGVGGAPANTDVSMIPGSLISRVDVLLDGASSVYGSDAVAGVINYVMRTDFEGVEVSASTRFNEHGWGRNDVMSLTTGVSNDRGYIGFAAEFDNQREVEKIDVLKAFDKGLTNLDGTPINVLCDRAVGQFPDGRQVAVCNDTPAGFLITGAFGTVIDSTGTSNIGIPGYNARPGSFFRPVDDPAINGFPENLGDTFLPGTKRVNLFTTGEYDLNTYGNMTLFFEGSYANRRLKSQVTQQEVLPIAASNPFNPFGSGGLFVYSTPNNTDQEINVVRTVSGLRGDLPDLNFATLNNWTYEAYASYHRSTGFQTIDGLGLEDRLAAGLNSRVDPASGRIVCDTATGDSFFGFDTVRAPIACVPLNPFNPDFLSTGRFATQAQNDFAYGRTGQKTEVEQIVISGFTTGEIFSFPQGGAAQVLVGGEYRKDKVHTVSSNSTRQGLLQGVNADVGSTGKRDLKEAFFELSLPIFQGQKFADSLEIDGAARYTKEEFSSGNWTYQIKGEYAPVSWIRVRGGYGTSFRAPDTGEQFGTGTIFIVPSQADPCNVGSLRINPITNTYDPALETRSSVLLANCRALGQDPTTLGTVGQGTPTLAFVSNPVAFGNFGNIATDPEKSNALFVGGSVSQPWFDSFTLRAGATYYEYEINGSIGQLTRGRILNDCLESVGLTDPLCAFQIRDAAGTLVEVNEASINLGQTTSRGVDVNVNLQYDIDWLPFTDDVVGLDWNTVATRSTNNTEDVLNNGNVTDNLGNLTLGGGFPKLQIVSTARFSWKDFGMTWRLRFIDGMEANNLGSNNSSFNPCFDFATGSPAPGCVNARLANDFYQNDVTFNYNHDSWSFRAGVLNLFNSVQTVDGSRSLNNVCIQCGHDTGGRSFFFSGTKNF
jgi:iron complex outermembrane receptor protein